MIPVWIPFCFLYVACLLFFGIFLCYSRSHVGMTWLEEVVIGLLSLVWPVVLLAFMTARLARLLSVRVVDPILLKLDPPKGEQE